ncbi:MAG: FAD:protein FMN transferase [Candidatus Bipolaricaulota bacterium]|nr:FAD:protein FMN transferase [Candidatus Bipolaricaulota bacterium]
MDKAFFPPPMSAFQDRREMMDTWVTITVYDRSPKQAEAAIDAAFSRMAQVEHVASIFDPQAEAYRLNEQGRLDDPSNDLWEVITAAIFDYSITDEAFDITVEPLLDLWRYKEGAGVQFWELDSEAQQKQIAQAMTLLGADRIKMITSPKRAIILEPRMKITLGGIAKGYAVDRGLDVLREQGIEHALIDAGGDIGAFGGKPNNEKWELALRNPKDENSSLVTFTITDGAIATSGNYERFFDPAAKVGHIMDPRTGYSSHASSSASVYAPTCTQADALATAVFVLGPKDGADLANLLSSTEALIVGYDDPQKIFESAGINTYIDQENGGE